MRAGKRLCVICGQCADMSRFRWDSAPICKWHDGWFMKRSIPDVLEPALQQKLHNLPPDLECWVSIPRRYCAHARNITDWDVRGVVCACEFCGHYEVTCYVRIARTNGRGWELDLVEGAKGLEMLETQRPDRPYARKCERRLPVVALTAI